MANPPLPYDQLSLSLRVIELGGWDNVMFKFPAGSNAGLDPGSSSDDVKRSYWLCTQHTRVRVPSKQFSAAQILLSGEDAVMAICAQRMFTGQIGQIIDVSTLNSFLCRRCNPTGARP